MPTEIPKDNNLRIPGPAPVPELLGKAGVTRVSALGHMTSPEAGWHHDGRFNLLDLISITEIEHSASAAADSFAEYKD